MVVSIDKATAVRMYDKVQKHWAERLAEAPAERGSGDATAELGADLARAEIAFMRDTDMAVVVSQAQNEIAEMAEAGLDIAPAPQADGRGGPRREVQGSRRPVPARVRLRDVDDRLRRAVAARRSTSTSRCGTTR